MIKTKKAQWPLITLLTLSFFTTSLSLAQGQEAAIDVKIIKTESIKKAQLQVDPGSFKGNTGLKGKVTIPEANEKSKTVYFTLKNQSGNFVWAASQKWQNVSHNGQKFVFDRDNFKNLSGPLTLEVKILDAFRKTVATTQTNLEINNPTNRLSTTIKPASRLDQKNDHLALSLRLDSQEPLADSVLRIDTYQDFLGLENVVKQQFFPLGSLSQGPKVENIRAELPPIAGNYLITAQVFDGLQNARSGQKQWEIFIPGNFLNYKYLDYELTLASEIKLNLKAGGASNIENIGLSLKDETLFLQDAPVEISQNSWNIDKSITLSENKPEYELDLKVYTDEQVINHKTLKIKNHFYTKKKRQDQVRNLIRTILRSDDFQIDPRIPVLEIIQFGFIAIFLCLAYLLFKKNKRF